jgi:carboxyl-terminal processing protease
MTVDLKKMIAGALIGAVIMAVIFSAGFLAGTTSSQLVSDDFLGFLGSSSNEAEPTNFPSPELIAISPDELQELFTPFWEAWTLAHERYVDQPLDDVSMMQGAINGMLEALGDPHTGYMDPHVYQQVSAELDGAYEGIGAWVDTTTEYLTIITPMRGSPAEEAGLQPGDQVVEIDGEDMTGVDGEIALQHVLGPAGTIVTLTVLREGESELLTFEIERAEITIPSIYTEMLDDNIAYVQLMTFGLTTDEDLRTSLQDLLEQDPVGLILDLRGNGGGYLVTAINVVSEFIDEGVVLIERFGDGTEETYEASGEGLATDIPMVVLIDPGSASASEIVAGAIQDYERGLIVGAAPSFGKGSVQDWIPLQGENGAVRITVARWYTPNGRQIADQGIMPDVLVDIPETDEAEEESTANPVDLVLEEAIQVLLEMIE